MESYFLGANTKDGFYSLYGDFPPEGVFLHILKGGPGTGKSSMLRAIAGAAKKRGLAVEQVPCSGDPESLDGIYLPALGQAWADGTAPHVLEPKLLGVTGDYINLTRFLIHPFSDKEKQDLLSLQKQNKDCYRLAYKALAACAEKGGSITTPQSEEAIDARLGSLPDRKERKTSRRCFLSAISCKGQISLTEQLRGYEIFPASPELIDKAREMIEAKGYDSVLCPSPLDPSIPEALLLPEEKLCLKTDPAPTEEAKEALQQAIFHLAEAKRIHDRIEQLYRPHMDFRALSEFTDTLIRELFS